MPRRIGEALEMKTLIEVILTKALANGHKD